MQQQDARRTLLAKSEAALAGAQGRLGAIGDELRRLAASGIDGPVAAALGKLQQEMASIEQEVAALARQLDSVRSRTWDFTVVRGDEGLVERLTAVPRENE